MNRLFGTDGMRGEAGVFPLDEATVEIAGRSLAQHLAQARGDLAAAGANSPPRIALGRDTRESGGWIERAFIKGATAGGALCESAGVITTPGVAYLTKTLPADAGVVISASHNPYHDNGIKIFAPSGRKLDEAIEKAIEADIWAEKQSAPQRDGGERTTQDALRRDDDRDASYSSSPAADLRRRYLDYLAQDIAGDLRLDDLSLVIDCANGAASQLAPELFAQLGAKVIALNNTPDGRNINRDCGSLHLEGLCQRVRESDADVGVGYDGDADRALFVNHRGEIVNGDATLWVMAKYLEARGELAGHRVVATVMSNIGLERALRTREIEMVRTDVGDKYVLEELLRSGAALGGEQSGHIIFPQISLAGDGMLTTLCLLRAMNDEGLSLAELTEGFQDYPQILVNVRVREKRPFAEVPAIARAAQRVENELGETGRLLLRYSGTEPLARVMIEGARKDQIEKLAYDLAETIKTAIG